MFKVFAMSSPPPRRKTISKVAAEAIGERVFEARFRTLADLSAIAIDRGSLTATQLGAVAALLVAARGEPEPDFDWRRELAEWLAGNELAPSLAALAPDVLGASLAADALRTLFEVADDDAERLGLRQLVSERLRSRIRRREEGVPPRRAEVAEPWKAAGVGRATWFRRLAAAKEAAKPDETPTTLFKEENARAHAIGSFESHARSAPDVSSLSAEERRYARRAAALGALWSDNADVTDPWTWFDIPPGLPDMEQAVLAVACEAAENARRRREAVARARARRAPPRPPRDPQACPARVSQAVWDEVPPERREDTALRAGRFFLAGMAPDDAIRAGLAAVLTEQARPVPGGEASQLTGPSPEVVERARMMAAQIAVPPYPESYADHALAALAEALARPENRRVAPLLLVEGARNVGYDRSRLKHRTGVQVRLELRQPNLGDTVESLHHAKLLEDDQPEAGGTEKDAVTIGGPQERAKDP
ncbi:hypothetical protein [Roseomonas sp. BN140053]|uniref:hypothetical protein n=1 Tax=Roseomonas sp. BN140053 TaxID=3391898 RepID=UPI0039EC5193